MCDKDESVSQNVFQKCKKFSQFYERLRNKRNRLSGSDTIKAQYSVLTSDNSDYDLVKFVFQDYLVEPESDKTWQQLHYEFSKKYLIDPDSDKSWQQLIYEKMDSTVRTAGFRSSNEFSFGQDSGVDLLNRFHFLYGGIQNDSSSTLKTPLWHFTQAPGFVAIDNPCDSANLSCIVKTRNNYIIRRGDYSQTDFDPDVREGYFGFKYNGPDLYLTLSFYDNRSDSLIMERQLKQGGATQYFPSPHNDCYFIISIPDD